VAAHQPQGGQGAQPFGTGPQRTRASSAVNSGQALAGIRTMMRMVTSRLGITPEAGGRWRNTGAGGDDDIAAREQGPRRRLEEARAAASEQHDVGLGLVTQRVPQTRSGPPRRCRSAACARYGASAGGGRTHHLGLSAAQRLLQPFPAHPPAPSCWISRSPPSSSAEVACWLVPEAC